MLNAEWTRVKFKDFLNDHGSDFIVKHAPAILYSKKDKEHEASNSLIAFFLVTSGILIYTSISLFLIEYYFNVIIFTAIIIISSILDIVLLLNYVHSRVYVKPIECWFEIHEHEGFYCFSYYPVFSGKVHPNKAKDIIYKLYRDEIFQDKIDIKQIELYGTLDESSSDKFDPIGFFFQYAKGTHFRGENIDRNSWTFFPHEFYSNDNFIATANWDHQFEWHSDLEKDFDKLNEFSPWIIKRWNQNNIKPLIKDYKQKINWKPRDIDSKPKLKPWKGEIEKQTYDNQNAHRDLEIIDEAIEKIFGKKVELTEIKDLERELVKFKIYFRDLHL